MAIVKKSGWPTLGNGAWLTDFLDTDRFFDADWLRQQSVPAANVMETDKGFEIELAVPGLSKKDFNITVQNHILSISSEKQEEKESKEEGYTRKEFGYSSFTRSFTLPENVSEENIHANYQDGILKIALAKKEVHVKSKAVPVQ